MLYPLGCIHGGYLHRQEEPTNEIHMSHMSGRYTLGTSCSAGKPNNEYNEE